MPINRGIMWEQNERSENVSVCKSVERKRAVMAAALLPLQQLQVQQLRAGSWESEVILLLHIYCNPFSIYLNNIDSPVDVGGFAEPR
jgi:hypothetical protein